MNQDCYRSCCGKYTKCIAYQRYWIPHKRSLPASCIRTQIQIKSRFSQTVLLGTFLLSYQKQPSPQLQPAQIHMVGFSIRLQRMVPWSIHSLVKIRVLILSAITTSIINVWTYHTVIFVHGESLSSIMYMCSIRLFYKFRDYVLPFLLIVRLTSCIKGHHTKHHMPSTSKHKKINKLSTYIQPYSL